MEVAPVEVAPVEEAPVLDEFDAAAGDSTSAEQDAAAIKIQASIRGKKQRKEQKELQEGAAKIQARFRGKNIFSFFFPKFKYLTVINFFFVLFFFYFFLSFFSFFTLSSLIFKFFHNR